MDGAHGNSIPIFSFHTDGTREELLFYSLAEGDTGARVSTRYLIVYDQEFRAESICIKIC
jgi:hypothetical protein